MTQFPKELGGVIGGITFEDAFCKLPNIIEFVDTKWLESKTTGIFLEFMKFVKNKLKNKDTRAEHIMRCYKYATNQRSLPSYMIKYRNNASSL